jgi:hypothetical protein
VDSFHSVRECLGLGSWIIHLRVRDGLLVARGIFILGGLIILFGRRGLPIDLRLQGVELLSFAFSCGQMLSVI